MDSLRVVRRTLKSRRRKNHTTRRMICISSAAAKGLASLKRYRVLPETDLDFYTSFPEDHDVPFEQVLKKLSDSESMAPQQMHEWFKEHDYRHSWR